jgi:hypothetical protein
MVFTGVLVQDLETPQVDGESGIQYLNRLVRLQRQFARLGNVVHDWRIIVYLVKGLRSEYHSMNTDTWGVHNLSIDTVKRDLRQKGMRIESRAQSHTAEPPTATAFAASHDDAATKLLKRQVSELQAQLKSLQGATSTRRASMTDAQRRFFVVFAMVVVRRAIAGPSAQITVPEVTLRRWTSRLFSGGHGRDGHPYEAILRGSTHVRGRWRNMDVVGRQRRHPSHD